MTDRPSAAASGPDLVDSDQLRVGAIWPSSQGSVPTQEIVAELADLAAVLDSGSWAIDPCPIPLSEVEVAWQTVDPAGKRVVLVP